MGPRGVISYAPYGRLCTDVTPSRHRVLLRRAAAHNPTARAHPRPPVQHPRGGHGHIPRKDAVLQLRVAPHGVPDEGRDWSLGQQLAHVRAHREGGEGQGSPWSLFRLYVRLVGQASRCVNRWRPLCSRDWGGHGFADPFTGICHLQSQVGMGVLF